MRDEYVRLPDAMGLLPIARQLLLASPHRGLHQSPATGGEGKMTKHQETCATCALNKCEIRNDCPDDETTTERRRQTITPWPEMPTE
jgi:hypothetical protein